MKPVKIDNEDIIKVIQSGFPYIQVGDRKFLLMEVNEVNQEGIYEVTDPAEEEQLLKALNQSNPIIPDDQIIKMLRY
ncbi:hypothetical protein [Paenibacillus sp. J2TS4]|uniref:hypothetical protein n=1 Tax=Paenibacillus sp. J2TS4 TaxID=2807194 RepID=UPI001B26AB2D|nr:hypothetical protein [Paenibacillus sp. J2TS4]GIP36067.1 hypothetical protein J2TS4_52770 [Paenibacillus sp. J2TS4]